jgi:DNA-binding NarL/FixJ family response regulator
VLPFPVDTPEPLLFGRARERALLLELVGRRGSGGALIIEGEAGIGKSALLADAVRAAEARGARRLTSTGLQGPTRSGYGGLHELLHPLLPDVDALPNRQRMALLTAFGMVDGPSPDRLLVSLAALGLLEEAAARHPLVLAIEDLQWLDRSTVAVISFISLHVSSVPITVLCTVRPGVDADTLPALGLDRLHLDGLSDDDARELVSVLGCDLSDLARRRILQESVGNPLALREFIAAVRQRGPAGSILQTRLPITKRLERTFLDRLGPLPSGSRSLLILIAAANGADFHDVMSAARTLDLTLEDLRPLEENDLVSVDGSDLRFRHPLIRSAAENAASTTEWVDAHLALASVMSGHDSAVWHRAAATIERDETVAGELEAVGRRASGRGALPEAAFALERAAMVSRGASQRSRRLVLAAESARSAGLTSEDVELLNRADWAEADSDTRTQAVLSRVILALTAGAPVPRPVEIAAVLASLPGEEHGPRRIKILWVLAVLMRSQHVTVSSWQDLRDKLDREDERNPLRTVALALLAPLGQAAETRGVLPDLVPRLADDPLALVSLAIASESLQDLDTALTCWGLAQEGFHESGAPADEMQAIRGRAHLLMLRGRVREGLADAEYAERMTAEMHQPLLQSMAAATAARGHSLLGDFAAATTALMRSAELAQDSQMALIVADARWAAGTVALAQHRYRDALIEYTHMTVHPTRSLWAIADRTEAAVRAGRPDDLRKNVEEAAVAAALYRSPFLSALVARSRALLADDDAAESYFAEALALGALSESPLEVARTQLLFGEWLRRQKRRKDACVQLTAALDQFETVGAQAFIERATQELRAAGQVGARPTAPSTAVQQLTPQELQVAQLAAAGLSNREIADRVYLSHRTVSTHLYKVFPKLGISSRGQLRHALGGATSD